MDRQTDRPTDRQTSRPTNRQIDRPTDRQTDRQIDTSTDRQISDQQTAKPRIWQSDKSNNHYSDRSIYYRISDVILIISFEPCLTSANHEQLSNNQLCCETDTLSHQPSRHNPDHLCRICLSGSHLGLSRHTIRYQARLRYHVAYFLVSHHYCNQRSSIGPVGHSAHPASSGEVCEKGTRASCHGHVLARCWK